MIGRGVSSCPQESDVLDLVVMEQWPARADAALVSHVDACATCRDLVTSVGAVVELRENAARPAVPDASIVWYRAQLRARQDAAHRAAQPMFAAQMVALAAFVGIGVLWIVTGAAGFESAWTWITGLVPTSASLSLTAENVAPGVWTAARWALYAMVACAVIGVIAFSIARLADDSEEQVRS
jgi:fumarate reductase subunit C